MTPQDFVDVIRLVVSDAAISDTVDVISSPPGRKPDKSLVEISEFYNCQSEDGKRNIEKIIKKSVEEAVFGFFCVLDGVRAIENSENKGSLSLLYEGDVIAKLNADADLHDRYNT
ncbi:hypothetical protein CU666_20805 [Pseudomonas syringae pv. actinidifoliorum]|nr:hypothetical protein [Pseudomonas syringae pv. actinidifoliorum]NAT60333.1 hypothetical protein [Pseudomonas syringae pv. actinidifoliorum]